MADFDKFWLKLKKSLDKNAVKGNNDCIIWIGSKDKYGYGRKKATWPNGSQSIEIIHRVAYMLHHRIVKEDVQRLAPDGSALDVSHTCNNKCCIKPSHLVLEKHQTNMSRIHCFGHNLYVCTHKPPCLLPALLQNERV